MNRKIKNHLAILGTFLLVVTTLPASAKEKAAASIPPNRAIEVYEGNFLNQPFTVLGKVHLKAGGLKKLKAKAQDITRRRGGDALLLYKVDNPGIPSYWTGSQISYAEGVVVKFDPQGIREITAQTAVPVLE